MAATAEREKPSADDLHRPVQLPRPRILTRPLWWTMPPASRLSGVTSSSPSSSRTSRLTTLYSTRNGFAKPRSFGFRWVRGSWPPSKPGLMLLRAFCPFVPRPAVLPPLPPVPLPTRRLGRFEPGEGAARAASCGLLLGDGDQMRHAGDHPADLRPVREDRSTGRSGRARVPQGPMDLNLDNLYLSTIGDKNSIFLSLLSLSFQCFLFSRRVNSFTPIISHNSIVSVVSFAKPILLPTISFLSFRLNHFGPS